jgi:putative membrane protein
VHRAGLIFAVITAVLHLYFLVLEMVLWTKPFGLKLFRQSLEQARASAALAANQGLYNGFLSAGLVWGMTTADPLSSLRICQFFLGCVVVAGIFGAITVNKRIFLIQALPAVVSLSLL